MKIDISKLKEMVGVDTDFLEIDNDKKYIINIKTPLSKHQIDQLAEAVKGLGIENKFLVIHGIDVAIYEIEK